MADMEKTLLVIGIAGAAMWAYSAIAKPPPAGVENASGAGAGVVNTATGAGAGLPRGIRNNNPLNIKFSAGNNWLGQIGKDSGGFVVFDTAGHGLRAGAKLIKTYITKYGLNTLAKIARRWSPDPTGLSGAYASTVSKFSNVDVNRVITIGDNAIIAAIVQGMVAEENGAAYLNRYTAADIGAAVTSV